MHAFQSQTINFQVAIAFWVVWHFIPRYEAGPPGAHCPGKARKVKINEKSQLLKITILEFSSPQRLWSHIIFYYRERQNTNWDNIQYLESVILFIINIYTCQINLKQTPCLSFALTIYRVKLSLGNLLRSL